MARNATAHLWVVEVRDRDRMRPGGWTAWKPYIYDGELAVYDTRDRARFACDWQRDGKDHRSVQYRVAFYDRREVKRG